VQAVLQAFDVHVILCFNDAQGFEAKLFLHRINDVGLEGFNV